MATEILLDQTAKVVTLGPSVRCGGVVTPTRPQSER